MKVKQSPEDFIVEELTDVQPGDAGDFAFYKLEKTGWTTPDAFAAVRRRWHIDHRRLSYGGLKDRHAVTTQFFSIHRGPLHNLRHERIAVTCLGRITHPYGPQDIRANRFAITLRALTETATLEAAVKEVARCGVPNYFDDQRFGSVGDDGRFIALEMIRRNFEEALKMALAAPYEFDRAADKSEKAVLRRYWGQWPECKAKLPKGHARSLVDYLVHHPTDFKGAVARLRPELNGLYLAAYQSHVWNRWLARWIRAANAESGKADRSLRSRLVTLSLKTGEFPALREPLPKFAELSLPLPSSRLKDAGEWRPLLDEVLAEDGLTLETMKVHGLERPYFAKGERPACLMPANLAAEIEPDERHNRRMKAILRFELGRGSYATMVVKRLVQSGP